MESCGTKEMVKNFLGVELEKIVARDIAHCIEHDYTRILNYKFPIYVKWDIPHNKLYKLVHRLVKMEINIVSSAKWSSHGDNCVELQFYCDFQNNKCRSITIADIDNGILDTVEIINKMYD